ncbi:MAG: insulinase family protein [Candidatus Blackburnbacteria bacterium]|nr:insulinase family protein [Candidatus Blackburnbacteria bacterium]
MLKTLTLKNGICVATYNLPNVRSFHFRITAKGGSIVEPIKTQGLAHFMEHMLLQGIPSFPTVELLSEYIESLSGTYNAVTSQHLISFYTTLPVTHTEDAVKISSEVFFESLFPEVALEKERRVILEEIRQGMDSTGYRLTKFFKETRFRKGSQLTAVGGGSTRAIAKFTRENLMDYWKKYLIPKNTYILAIGKFDSENLLKLLEKYFGRYEEERSFDGFPMFSKDHFSARQVALRFDPKLRSNYIDITFPSLPAELPLKLRLQQSLLLTILSNLSRSRLFKLLRHQLGIVYGVSAGSYTTDGLGYVQISSEAASGNLEQVISLITQELSGFVKNGPTEEELGVAKEFLSNRWLMLFDHPTSIAGWVENDLLWEERVRLPEEIIELIKNTDVGELISLMEKYWDFSKLNLSIQGAVRNTRENVQKFSEILEVL